MNPKSLVKKIARAIRRLISIPVAIYEEVYISLFYAKERDFSAFGMRFLGQGYMARTYEKVDDVEFQKIIDEEIDFVRKNRKLDEVVVVDAGANIGFYSVAYSLSGNTRVIAYEPFPETCGYLQKNIAENSIQNVDVVCKGLFSKTKRMKIGAPRSFNLYTFIAKITHFSDRNQSGCKSIYTDDADAIEVEFQSGDECKVLASERAIGLIKIDVEGAELDVIKGVRNIIVDQQPVLKIEFNINAFDAAGVKSEDIFKSLDEFGYKHYQICPIVDSSDAWRDIRDIPKIKGTPDVLFCV